MKTVQLLPLNARFKQLIKAHGKIWVVLEERLNVICFAGRPGLFITNIEGPVHQRWVETNAVTVKDKDAKTIRST
jgi:hypothetical protein